MRGMPRALPSLLACLLAVLFVGPTSAWAEEGAPAGEGRSDVAVALGQLASPVLTERREAVERLLTLMPGARPTLIAALRGATWSVQVQLLEVLARDGGDGSVDALLQHLVQADEAQGVRIRLTLVRDEKASARLLAAWRKDPEAFTQRGGPKGARRLQELADLLRRAEIEATFLARKSKSGSTGYYKGQYDALKGVDRKPGYRKLALQVVTGIAIVNLIQPGVGAELAMLEEGAVSGIVTEAPGGIGAVLWQQLEGLIPKNPLAAATRGDMLPVIFFSLLIGVFISVAEHREGSADASVVRRFFSGLFDVMMQMTLFVVKFAPIGVFGFKLYAAAGKGPWVGLASLRAVGRGVSGVAHVAEGDPGCGERAVQEGFEVAV